MKLNSKLRTPYTLLLLLFATLFVYQCEQVEEESSLSPLEEVTFDKVVQQYIADLKQNQENSKGTAQLRSSGGCGPDPNDPGCAGGSGQIAEVFMAEYNCFAVVEYDYQICWDPINGMTYSIFNVQIYPSATSCSELLAHWQDLFDQGLFEQLEDEMELFELTLEQNYLHLVFEDGLNYLLQYIHCSEGGQIVLTNYWDKVCTRRCMYMGEISIDPSNNPPSILTFSCGNLCCVTSQSMCWNGDQLQAVEGSITTTLYGTGDCDGEPPTQIEECGEGYIAIGECNASPCED